MSAWYSGYLTAIATNDSKKFPKTPEEMWSKASNDAMPISVLVADAKNRKQQKDLETFIAKRKPRKNNSKNKRR